MKTRKHTPTFYQGQTVGVYGHAWTAKITKVDWHNGQYLYRVQVQRQGTNNPFFFSAPASHFYTILPLS